MRLVLLGSPGVGKGTQAKFIAEKWHIPHISTGDILRVAVNTESPLGKQAKQIMDEGRLVSDEIMIQLMTERLQQSDCQNGFLLDGFPRTLEQAKSLEQILTAHHTPLDLIIQIKVPETEIIKRLSGRRVHLASGRVYHVTYHPPKEPGLDDETKEPLIQRPDDHEETIRKRLAVYHQQTEPLIKFYQSKQPLPFKSLASPPIYYEIDGNQSVEAVHAALNQVLDMQPGVVRY